MCPARYIVKYRLNFLFYNQDGHVSCSAPWLCFVNFYSRIEYVGPHQVKCVFRDIILYCQTIVKALMFEFQ